MYTCLSFLLVLLFCCCDKNTKVTWGRKFTLACVSRGTWVCEGRPVGVVAGTWSWALTPHIASMKQWEQLKTAPVFKFSSPVKISSDKGTPCKLPKWCQVFKSVSLWGISPRKLLQFSIRKQLDNQHQRQVYKNHRCSLVHGWVLVLHCPAAD